MNTDQCMSTLPLSRPLTERVANEVFEALSAMHIAMTRAWRRRKAQNDGRRAHEAIAALNQHVLQDIGAPHWMVARAVEREQARHLPCVEADFR